MYTVSTPLGLQPITHTIACCWWIHQQGNNFAMDVEDKASTRVMQNLMTALWGDLLPSWEMYIGGSTLRWEVFKWASRWCPLIRRVPVTSPPPLHFIAVTFFMECVSWKQFPFRIWPTQGKVCHCTMFNIICLNNFFKVVVRQCWWIYFTMKFLWKRNKEFTFIHSCWMFTQVCRNQSSAIFLFLFRNVELQKISILPP